jgi:hypothetical protein
VKQNIWSKLKTGIKSTQEQTGYDQGLAMITDLMKDSSTLDEEVKTDMIEAADAILTNMESDSDAKLSKDTAVMLMMQVESSLKTDSSDTAVTTNEATIRQERAKRAKKTTAIVQKTMKAIGSDLPAGEKETVTTETTSFTVENSYTHELRKTEKHTVGSSSGAGSRGSASATFAIPASVFEDSVSDDVEAVQLNCYSSKVNPYESNANDFGSSDEYVDASEGMQMLSIRDESGNEIQVRDTRDPIIITFPRSASAPKHSAKAHVCRHFDPASETWKSQGCTVVSCDDTTCTAEVNHLTMFSLVVSTTESAASGSTSGSAASVIGIAVGCTFAALAMGLFLMWKYKRNKTTPGVPGLTQLPRSGAVSPEASVIDGQADSWLGNKGDVEVMDSTNSPAASPNSRIVSSDLLNSRGNSIEV